MILTGSCNQASIFTDTIDEASKNQIETFLNEPMFKDEQICIMPDVHAGKGSVVGFTSTFKNGIVCPNVVGVDIGCGVLAANLGQIDIDFAKLDDVINTYIPSGFSVHSSPVNLVEASDFLTDAKNACRLLSFDISDKKDYILRSIGTLGGGNHFIEVDEDPITNEKYLIIHTGSRNLGVMTCVHHQNKATPLTENTPKELFSLSGELAKTYLHDMELVQFYASANRSVIYKIIAKYMGFNLYAPRFESVHNYIDMSDKIIRKGSISADKGEPVIIPLNMRDGCIIGTGKGNANMNFSAPHGAGRLYSRGDAKRELKLEDFQKAMEGIYSSSVCKETLDEAPFAYKAAEDILKHINDTVTVDKIIKPLYNFKAH